MTTVESKLPTEDRPVQFDPDGAKALEKLLAPHEGADLRKAQAAVLKIRASGASGLFGELFGPDGVYARAIAEAVGA